MIVVAPCGFEVDFEADAELERALAAHELRVVADPAAQRDALAAGEVLVTGFESQWQDPLDYVRAMPRLRWIHSLIAGVRPIATPDVVERGIIVTNGAGVFATPIAEYAFAALVMLARDLPRLVLASAEGRWAAPHTVGRELCGRTAGVIGYGGIGRRVAQLLAAAGMRVLAVTRTPAAHPPGPAEVLGTDGLDRLLGESDAIVLCASLNPATEGMIGARELARCRPDALLVNIARGRLIDEAALAAALRDGPLAAAWVDVTAVEPLPPDSPLWRIPNLWITPHIAGGTHEANARVLERFAGNLEALAAGEADRMVSVVDLRRELSGR